MVPGWKYNIFFGWRFHRSRWCPMTLKKLQHKHFGLTNHIRRSFFIWVITVHLASSTIHPTFKFSNRLIIDQRSPNRTKILALYQFGYAKNDKHTHFFWYLEMHDIPWQDISTPNIGRTFLQYWHVCLRASIELILCRFQKH